MNRVFNMFFRQLMNRGVRAGIDQVTRGGKSHAEMDYDERMDARQRSNQLQTARRSMNLLRRFMR